MPYVVGEKLPSTLPFMMWRGPGTGEEPSSTLPGVAIPALGLPMAMDAGGLTAFPDGICPWTAPVGT